eukprot:TRINITY_DN1020_c0_g1_i3.p1 TRINITY_DN1020_c0_g1~~TRINITY_DN1020_c0_g1_i3.p1  ORF type:complete len:1092 (+),score=215.59 TRINITY_DN1020_c0_g1_i3:462-3278(+)
MIVDAGGTPAYIKINVPNSLFYILNTPSDLPAGSYKIMVFFSKDPVYPIFAESVPFVAENPCNHINCLNGGKCQNGHCICTKNFGGTQCEKSISGFSNCDNQGVCTCVANYHGDFCMTPKNCNPLLCKNGAVPKSKNTCPTMCTAPDSEICPIGFKGTLCDTCTTECKNGGVIDPGDCLNCNCASGFFSSTCTCEYATISVAMKNAQPKLLTASWKSIVTNDFARALKLDPKWIGIDANTYSTNGFTVVLFDPFCTLNSELMANIAYIKEQMHDAFSILRRGYKTFDIDPKIFSYVSPPSWVDNCPTRTCSGNGQCDVESGTCKCFPGFIGDNCAIVDLCYGKNCNDKGSCSVGICTCTSTGWHGENCNIPPNSCQGRTCSGHGVCQNSMCQCNDGWTGQECDISPNACYGKNCGGNGACFGGKCKCFEGFEGVDCGIKINLCPVGKCNYHGTCNPTTGACSCETGYTGLTCSEEPASCSDGKKNQNEEKVDCGGDKCDPCPSCTNKIKDPGEAAIDCGGSCLPCPTCGDGIKNGLETGIDCGGSSCAPCGSSPSCTDGSKNGQETGIDCGDLAGTCPKCVIYVWYAQDVWSSCTAACGEGIQTRERFCKVKSTGSTVDDALCSHLHPVSKTQSCNEQPCWKYTWNHGQWGDCSMPCGTGIRIRELTCSRDDKKIVPLAHCEAKAGEKPIEKEACKPQACVAGSFYWSSNPVWGDCTKGCGSGTQSREVVCIDHEQRTVSSSKCSISDKLPSSRDCNTHACVSYSWHLCKWEACTAECGGGDDGGKAGGAMMGEETRKIMCKRSDGVMVDESYCDPNVRKTLMDSRVGCNPKPCTDYNWMTTKWSGCLNPDSTGKGVRKRTYHCHSPDGGNARIQDCEQKVGWKKPITSQNCEIDKCPSAIIPPIASSAYARSLLMTGSSIIMWAVVLNCFVASIFLN